MGRLTMLGGKVATLNPSRAQPAPKQVDSHYLTPGHQAWRSAVIANAGRRCEWVENGVRCPKAEPNHRMFADHTVELQDGGAPFDPANGKCFCGAHHSLKTAREREARQAR